MDIERDLLKEIQRTKAYIDGLEQEIAINKDKVGDRRLVCSTSNKVPQYKINGQYVSKKNLGEARAIAQLQYNSKMLEIWKNKLGYMEKLLLYYSDNKADSIYEKMCDGRQRLVSPYDMQRNKFVQEWENTCFESYDRWDDIKTEFYTSKGERVRSKSEMIIANEFASYGVPYRYESPIELKDGNKMIIFHPDFVALNRRTLNEYVVEHLGMMDKLGYYNSNLNKIEIMEKNGYLLGINYLLFHETAENPINVQVIRRYIEEYLI